MITRKGKRVAGNCRNGLMRSFITFIVAPCIMEFICCSFTNNCTFY